MPPNPSELMSLGIEQQWLLTSKNGVKPGINAVMKEHTTTCSFAKRDHI